MDWQTIREQYPDCWVLIEGFDTYDDNGYRMVPRMQVLGNFSEWNEVWRAYKTEHQQTPMRELYFAHTDREVLEIKVLSRWGRFVR